MTELMVAKGLCAKIGDCPDTPDLLTVVLLGMSVLGMLFALVLFANWFINRR